MSSKIRLLRFRSNKSLQPIQMYCYHVDFSACYREESKNRILNSYLKFLNGNRSYRNYSAIHDGTDVYTLKQIQDADLSRDLVLASGINKINVVLAYHGDIPMDEEHKKIYEEIILANLKSRLLSRNETKESISDYKRYKIFDDYDGDISTRFISVFDSNGVRIGSSECSNQIYRLRRIFPLKIDFHLDSHHFDVSVQQRTIIESIKSLHELHKAGYSVEGKRFRYVFGSSKHHKTGIVSFDVPKGDYDTVQKLVVYYEKKYHLNNLSDRIPSDDFVVSLDGSPYLASMLFQVMSTDALKSADPVFWNVCRNRFFLPMYYRYCEILPLVQRLEFSLGNQTAGIYMSTNGARIPLALRPSNCGFNEFKFDSPALLFGNNKQSNNKKNLMSSGPYLPPTCFSDKSEIRVALSNMSLKHSVSEENLKKFFQIICQRWFKDCNGFSPDFLKRVSFRFYPYERDKESSEFSFARKIKMDFNPALAFCCIDDERKEILNDSDELYPEIKRAFADNMNGIPSQMFTYERLCMILSKKKYWECHADNIFLGILGKLGGVPYVLAENPFNIDLIIGLDVGMQQKGKHTPVAASVFTGTGGFLGVLAPKSSIVGEKIEFEELKKMFDRLFAVYQEIRFNKKHQLPKHILLIRDGFAREGSKQLDSYFSRLGISYRFVEVRKSGGVDERFCDGGEQNYNPVPGTCILNAKENYSVLVSSIPKSGGAPRPIKICLGDGNLNLTLLDVTKQIYWLTKLNSASFDNTRLPEPQRVADIISKNPDFLPIDKVVFHRYWL